MADTHGALRHYVRSSKARSLFETIMDSDDPVWAEDEFVNDVAQLAKRALDNMAGEWQTASRLFEFVANEVAADAERVDSGTGRRAAEALRRLAAVLR